MNRNPRNKHLKRIAAPKHWLLDKLSGVWAPRPSPGPHKLRECLPMIIMVRNRLKYALTAREVKMIVKSRHIRVDGKVRTDTKFPCGFQDVVTINRTGEHFRLIYDTKGRFALVRISVNDAHWKLLKVKKKALGSRGIPYIVTHDGRTIPYPNPKIKINDTIKYDFMKGKVLEIAPMRDGATVMVIGGRNIGRVGTLEKTEVHPGSFDIVYIKDSAGHNFATRKDNIFVLGSGSKPFVKLPRDRGIKLSIKEDRDRKLRNNTNPRRNQNDKKNFVEKHTKDLQKLLPAKESALREIHRDKLGLIKQIKEQEAKNRKNKPKKNTKKKKSKRINYN